MSEKFTTPQERDEAIDASRDFISVDNRDRAHVPAGSGSKSGNFMSDHELAMIEANKDLIYDGLENKESEALLEAIGDTTDVSEIREAMVEYGFIHEDDDWTDQEILDMAAEKRAEVADFYGVPTQPENMKRFEERLDQTSDSASEEDVVAGKRRADVEVDAPSQAEGYVRKQDRQPGAHKADFSDEDSPIFNELATTYQVSQETAQEGESLEEYEARNGAGRHRLTELPTAELDAIANGGTVSPLEELPTDELDAIARGEAATEETDDEPVLDTRSRWQRTRDVLSPSGIAARMSARAYARKERRADDEESDNERTHGKAVAVVGGLALVGAGVVGYIMMNHGGHATGHGTWINNLVPGNGGHHGHNHHPQTIPGHNFGHNGLSWNDFDPSAHHVERGEGWYSTFEQMGIPKEHWSNVLHSAGPKLQKIGEAYFDNDANEYRISRPGNLSSGALRIIVASARKDGVSF